MVTSLLSQCSYIEIAAVAKLLDDNGAERLVRVFPTAPLAVRTVGALQAISGRVGAREETDSQCAFAGHPKNNLAASISRPTGRRSQISN